MAIKLEPNPTFRVNVKIPVPGGTGFEIDCEFRHKTTKEKDEYIRSKGGDLAAVQDILVGWKDDAVPYSDETLIVLLDNYPSAATAIVGAYLSELVGARRGN